MLLITPESTHQPATPLGQVVIIQTNTSPLNGDSFKPRAVCGSGDELVEDLMQQPLGMLTPKAGAVSIKPPMLLYSVAPGTVVRIPVLVARFGTLLHRARAAALVRGSPVTT